MSCLRAWITDAFAKRRKVRVKGSVKIEEDMVWESLRLRKLRSSEEGNPAASKRVCKRLNIVGNEEEDELIKTWDRRTDKEKGRARIAATKV